MSMLAITDHWGLQDWKREQRPRNAPAPTLHYQRTADAEPPLGVPLAVVHKFANFPGGMKDEEAVWTGQFWVSFGRIVEKSYYYLWRKLPS